MTHQHILILGAGYGGLSTAGRLARRLKASDVTITLVNAEDVFVERIRNHQVSAGQHVKKRRLSHILKGTKVQFLQGRVLSIAPERQSVLIQTQHGRIEQPYDHLVYALGSRVDISAVPGVAEYAYTMDWESARRLSQQLPAVAQRGGRLVIIGGGLTGIEAATEFAEAYPNLEVTLLTSGSFGSAFSRKGREHLRKTFDRLGIKLYEHQTVRGLTATHIETVEWTYPYDLCIWAGGFRGLPIAREAGLRVNAHDRILTDTTLRALSHPNIWAVGDSASSLAPSGYDYRMACATAIPMGLHVADNIADIVRGGEAKPFNLGYVIWCISLGRRDGLIQFLHSDDTPRERVLTGWGAAIFKELVCRYAVGSVMAERRMDFYFWPKQPIEERILVAGH